MRTEMEARTRRHGRRAAGGAVRRALVLSIAIVSCIPTACRSPDGADRAVSNVLVVVVDACRADKLGAYGFDRPAAPVIDALARDPDAVVFEHHYVQGDWTKPSTASLFTGLYVSQHRVALGPEHQDTSYWLQALPAGFDTLAEGFQRSGHRTFAAVRIPHLLPKYGFAQGFDSFGYYGDDLQAVRDSLALTARTEQPFFGYLHLIGCHDPYPAGDRDAEYVERYGFEYDEERRKAEGLDFGDPGLQRVLGYSVPFSDEDVRFLHLIHEAKLRAMNRNVIAPLLDGLREQGNYDDTLIVLTADHGQELLEHGFYTHSHALWEEIIHVPLIVKFPRGTRPEMLGERWPGLTRSIDLYPSLLGAIGARLPEDLPGVDLFSAPRIDIVLAERYSAGAQVDWAAIRKRYKAIRAVGRPPQLFDLDRDPGERENLAASASSELEALERAVTALRERNPMPMVERDGSRPELTEEEMEALRSLGYVQ